MYVLQMYWKFNLLKCQQNSAMSRNFKKSELYLYTLKSNAECFSHDVFFLFATL